MIFLIVQSPALTSHFQFLIYFDTLDASVKSVTKLATYVYKVRSYIHNSYVCI